MKLSSCLFNSLLLSAGVGLLSPLAQAAETGDDSKPTSLELDTAFVTASGGATDLKERRPVSASSPVRKSNVSRSMTSTPCCAGCRV